MTARETTRVTGSGGYSAGGAAVCRSASASARRLAIRSSSTKTRRGTATKSASSHPPWCASTGPLYEWAERAGPYTEGVEAAVLATLEVIRPALQADGGDIVLKSVDEASGRVEVELVGACGSCPASTMTMKAGIERILKDRVEGVTEVVEA